MSVWNEKLRTLLIAAVLIVAAGLLAILMKSGAVSEKRKGELVERLSCGANLSALNKAIQFYAEDSDGRLPPAENWCDSLVEHTHTPLRYFLCKAADADEGQSCYTMNKNVAGKKLSELAGDVVLLFEARPAWNQYGGPELLTLENHQGEGCNVLFSDGRMEFVKADQIGQLNWGIE